MGQTSSNLNLKKMRGNDHPEYELHWQADQLEKKNMGSLYIEDWELNGRWIEPTRIWINCDAEENRQILKKITKLSPHLSELNSIYFKRIKNRKAYMKCMNYCTKLKSQLTGNDLKEVLICGSQANLEQDNFSFYARSMLRLVSMATELVYIEAFKISHKHFGRILMSCNNTQKLCFRRCQVNVANLDYLDHVGDTKDARPSIKNLRLEFNTFIQPEEDSENLDGLMQKMAESRLNTCLFTVEIWLKTMSLNAFICQPKKEYKCGNFNVTISYLPF
ncbi:unnamed protein product [Moneuplotes crassus]|uniref:Uncharacterized protein n=1 Tax=Euplotes crassus TaxID=5936 RepID=A0AAD2CXR6_EUPCR|nr:unnamed protein product [Moneuplotes crassus]